MLWFAPAGRQTLGSSDAPFRHTVPTHRSDTPQEVLPPLSGGNLTGTVLQGNYQVDGVLRGGPNFTIYEAEHLRLARRVVVKCLSAHLSRDAFLVSRFEREVELLSSFRHPHIVAIHDYDSTEDGRPYAVMEFLSGQSLLQHIREKTKFSPGVAIEMVSQIGSALGAAHAMNIVHGALNPANIFLSAEKKDVFVKLMGFDAQAQTRIKPEDDQRSLAVILYELLTGRPMTGFPSGRSLPQGVAPVVLRALEKNAEERFESVLAFCHALRKAVGLKSHRASLSPPRESHVRPRADAKKDSDEPPFELLPCRAPTLRGGSVEPGAPLSLWAS